MFLSHKMSNDKTEIERLSLRTATGRERVTRARERVERAQYDLRTSHLGLGEKHVKEDGGGLPLTAWGAAAQCTLSHVSLKTDDKTTRLKEKEKRSTTRETRLVLFIDPVYETALRLTSYLLSPQTRPQAIKTC